MKKRRHFWQGTPPDFVFQNTVILSRSILCLETSHDATVNQVPKPRNHKSL